MKRIVIAALTLCLLLSGCARKTPEEPELKQYNATFLNLFDTVTTVVGRAESQEAFRAQAEKIRDNLEYYHQRFDIYHDYEGIANLKTVNDQAGIAPAKVDKAVMDLLRDCKTYYELTGGKVNAAMGSVLSLWHDARADALHDPRDARLPDSQALKDAATHMDMACLVLDETVSTAYLTDPQASLDVGAIAKGWATERVAQAAPSGMLISVGGNVCATGPKLPDGTPWVIGIQNPDNSAENVHTIYVTGGCVVTSGDYQRVFAVDGKRYHHIIDPKTQMPAEYWRSVTVVCGDSGLADALSTALFVMPLEQGRALAQQCGAEVLWIDAAGAEHMTPGFQKMLRT